MHSHKRFFNPRLVLLTLVGTCRIISHDSGLSSADLSLLLNPGKSRFYVPILIRVSLCSLCQSRKFDKAIQLGRYVSISTAHPHEY